jgi:hypothetical protein
MTSAGVYWIAGIFQCIAILLGVVAYLISKHESDTDTAQIIANLRSTGDEIVGQQHTNTEQIIARHSESEQRIRANQDSSTKRFESKLDELLAELNKRNESLRDTLLEKYPFGYVLFGSKDGVDGAWIPNYRRGLEIETESWGDWRMSIDSERKIFRLQFAPFRIKLRGREHGVIWAGRAENPYQLGKPCFVIVEGAGTQCVVEIIDDNERSPMWAIGFREIPNDNAAALK